MISVLYVDDEPELLEIGKLFLDKSGLFSVDTVTSAPEGLLAIEGKRYDAIISDYQMPGMNGIEFLKKVRASGNTVPFIIFTGRGREEVVIEALNEGADFYLQKGGEPVSQFAELAHKLRKAVLERRAETSLRDHERREADIINFLPDATFAIDNRGIVIAWNRAMEQMTGIRSSDILGKGNYEYALPFYKERRTILIDLVLRDDPATEAKYPYIKRSEDKLFSEMIIPHLNDGKGAVIWFTASPLYDTQGKIIGAIESIRDITARKEAERALHESELKYRTVFETTGAATVLVENDGTISLANSEFERLSGYRKDEIENKKKWMEFVVKEDVDRMLVQHRLRRQESQKALTHYEFRFRSRSGEIRQIYLTIDVISGTTKSVASLLDITDLKRTEEKLMVANIEYTGLLSQIQDVYYRSDSEGRLVKASRSWATLLGYDDISECLGRSIADDFYFNPVNRKQFLEKVYENGKVTDYEVELKRKDGTKVCISTSSHLYYDPAGNILGIEGTFRDITEQKQRDHILRTQLDLGITLQSVRGLNDTMKACLDAAIEISGMDAGGIYVVNQVSGSIDLVVSHNLGGEFVQSVSHYPSDSDNSRLVMAGKPIYVQYSKTGIFHTPLQKKEGLKASAIIPILSNKRVIACLNTSSHSLNEVPEISRVALETIAIQIEAAIERLRADEALAESEQRYRNVVEDQTEFISRFLPDGTHVFVNDAYCRYFGLKRVEILGHRFRPDIPVEEQERVKHFFKSLSPDHPVGTIEHRIIMPDGGVRWQWWSDRAIFDSSGKVIEYQSVGRDMTATKEAEIALQASEAWLRTIMDSIQTGIVIIDAVTHKILDANPKALEMIGAEKGEVVGSICHQFICPCEQGQCPMTDFGQKIDASERILVTIQGVHVPVLKTVIPAMFGGYKVLVESLSDISELKHREELYRSLAESTNDLIFVLDSENRIVYVNTSAASMIGAPNQDLIGKERNCLFPPEISEKQNIAISKVFETGEQFHSTGKLSFGGRTYWFDHSLVPLHDVSGTVTQILGISRDITGIIQAEAAIREANRKINLLTNITRHDVANQVTVLKGFAQLALMERPDPVVSDLLLKIDAAGTTIARQIEFTKTYQELGMHVPMWYRVSEMVSHPKPEYITVSCTCEAEIFADPMLEKVFFNLIDNSIRHGGTVFKITIRCEQGLDGLTILVEDDGNGVSPDKKEKIFEKGYGKNTGFGLFLAREILAITGITIRETGVHGEGARFEIKVPRESYRSFKR